MYESLIVIQKYDSIIVIFAQASVVIWSDTVVLSGLFYVGWIKKEQA